MKNVLEILIYSFVILYNLETYAQNKIINDKYYIRTEGPIKISRPIYYEIKFKEKIDLFRKKIFFNLEDMNNIIDLNNYNSFNIIFTEGPTTLLLESKEFAKEIEQNYLIKAEYATLDSNNKIINGHKQNELFFKIKIGIKSESIEHGINVDSINTNTIFIKKLDDKIKRLKLNELSIVYSKDFKATDTLFIKNGIHYLLILNSSPPGALIYLGSNKKNIESTGKTTPDTLSTAFKEVFIILKKKGYKKVMMKITLNENQNNSYFYPLEKRKYEFFIWGTSAFIYWGLWNYIKSPRNAPPKIPYPADFPK